MLATIATSTLDLSFLVDDLQHVHGYSRADAVEIIGVYDMFFRLRAERDEPIVPPAVVDEAWHLHLDRPERYAADCNQLCGRYIPHRPNIGPETQRIGWARTRKLFKDEYGTDLMQSRIAGMRRPGECN